MSTKNAETGAKHTDSTTPDTPKILRERLLFWVLLGVFILLGVIEWAIIHVVKQLPLSTSVVFFIILNINVIIAIFLIFLTIRHILRFVFGFRGKFFRKSLKMKLSIIFLAFSILPTILIFLVSFFYIHSTFDQWFKQQVVKSVEEAVDLTTYYYDVTHRMLSNESAHLKNISHEAIASHENPCEALRDALVYSEWLLLVGRDGKPICEWSATPLTANVRDIVPVNEAQPNTILRFAGGEMIYRTLDRPKLGRMFFGVIFPKEYVDKVASVVFLSQELKSLNPYAVPLKSVYTIALIAMTALLLFSSIWIGIYIADRLTKPLSEMSDTMALAEHGEYKKLTVMPEEQHEVKIVKDTYNQMVVRWENTKKQLEAALTDVKDVNFDMAIQKKFVEFVLNDLDSAIILFNSGSEVVFHNTTFIRQFAVKDKKLAFVDQCPVSLQSVLLEFAKNAKKRGGTQVQRLVRELILDNDARTYEVLLRTLVIPDGNDVLYLAIFHDLTDVQREQTLAAWQEVAQRVAHEIKNPLTPIQLLTERLMRKLNKNEPIKDSDLKDTFNSTLQQVSLIKKLVGEFTKVANFPSITPSLGNMTTLTDAIREVFDPLCGQNGVRFELFVEPDIPPFPYDLKALLQVFQNLIQNSIQASYGLSRKNLFIRLSTRYNRRLKLIHFTIEDNGPGIDSSIISRIFYPNFTTKEKGMGLGLSICKKIVEEHGGRIQVISNVDGGTKFMIELPVYRQLMNDEVAKEGARVT